MTTYYVDPANGNNSNSGTSLNDAFEDLMPVEVDGKVNLQAGDVVKVRDTAVMYPPSKPTWWQTSGTADNPIVIEAYENESPIIDCSKYDGTHGLDLLGTQHMVFRGLEIRNAGKNAVRCNGTDGQDARECLFEDLHIHHYGQNSQWAGNGIIFYGKSFDHVVRNVVAHHGSTGGGSDGFYVGGSSGAGRGGGHRYENCVAYLNADDGFDFYDADPKHPNVMVNCVAHHNGHDGMGTTGDGNGFKVGGPDFETGNNVLKRCVAYKNDERGFNTNGARVPNEFYNCTSWDNGSYGYHFSGSADNVVRNCASFDNDKSDVESLWNADSAYNSWDLGISNPEFETTDPSSDNFLRPKDSSPLVDAGTDVGLDYAGDAPDLGAIRSEDSINTSEPEPTSPTAALKFNDGTQHVSPVGVRYYDGSQWVATSLKVMMDGGFVEAFGKVPYDGSSTDGSTSDGSTTDDSTSDGSTSGGSTTILEDFTNGLGNYVGDVSSFSIVSAPSVRGNAGLLYDKTGSDKLILRDSPSTTVVQDTTYRANIYAHSGGNYGKVYFFANGSSWSDVSGYAIEYDTNKTVSPQFKLLRLDNGSLTVLDEVSVSPKLEEWMDVEFTPKSDGSIVARLYDASGSEVASVSANDTTYTSGTYGFGCNNPKVSFDYLREV
ncbi:cell wall/surface repeat protein [Haloferax elongans ATCC BAA-1513]|uniref:Cell wall/surface repeat protein n=1 Tax=Haloferax elongans ATCC BAA-1513 TaxID=1230453 RepID=M0HJV8_HALEO|nr:right-handed parallel beta-helix repeat-containing protein [Haloferax elongans]ELZ84781.1 cell wall/surface repeat protein [Haloferax elongans ATCC BAA-1513]